MGLRKQVATGREVDRDAGTAEALSNVEVCNGLECKLSCATSKANACLNTHFPAVRCPHLRVSQSRLGEQVAVTFAFETRAVLIWQYWSPGLQVSYVLDTEDIFKRAKPAGQDPREGQIRALRSSRFHSWLDYRHQQQVQQTSAVMASNPLLEATAA